MRDLFHNLNLLLPGRTVIPRVGGLLTGVLLASADIPVMAHDTELPFGNPPSRQEDRAVGGSVSPSVALRLGAALEAKTAQEVFCTCPPLAESLDIVDVRRRGDVVASDNDPKLDMFVWLYNDLVDVIRDFTSANDPVEVVSQMTSFAIVCDDGSICGSVSYNEAVVSIGLVLVRQCEVAFADASYLGENNIAVWVRSKHQPRRFSRNVAKPEFKEGKCIVAAYLGGLCRFPGAAATVAPPRRFLQRDFGWHASRRGRLNRQLGIAVPLVLVRIDPSDQVCVCHD
jgi:hypothetical protein